MAKMLISSAAISASRYSRRFSMMAAQNQWRSRTLASAGVEAELRPHEAHQAGVLQRQFLGAHFHRAAAQFRMADQVLAAFLLEQQAGALALQQQDGGQQVLGDLVQRALDHPRGQLLRAAARGSRAGSGGGLPAAEPADKAWAVVATPCSRVTSTRQSSSGSSWAARASARHSRRPSQITCPSSSSSRSRCSARRARCCLRCVNFVVPALRKSVRRKVPLAIKASIRFPERGRSPRPVVRNRCSQWPCGLPCPGGITAWLAARAGRRRRRKR